jgi:hypothetical protein
MARRKKTKRPTKLQATQRRLAAVEWSLVKAYESNAELQAQNLRLAGLVEPERVAAEVNAAAAIVRDRLRGDLTVASQGLAEALTPVPSPVTGSDPFRGGPRCRAVDPKTGIRCGEFEQHGPVHGYPSGPAGAQRWIHFELPVGDAIGETPPGCTCGAVWIDANLGARSCGHSRGCALVSDLLPSGRAPEPPPHGDEHAPPWLSAGHHSGDANVLGPPCVRCGVRFDVHSMDAGHPYEAPALVGAGDLKTPVVQP